MLMARTWQQSFFLFAAIWRPDVRLQIYAFYLGKQFYFFFLLNPLEPFGS